MNEKIAENAAVSWTEIPYAEAKKRKDIIQFFGEKYGDTVRVLQIGGAPNALNGYSMELCGGTHVRSTNEIGPFRIVKEEAIAAGIRRIEAVAGDAARKWAEQEAARQKEKFETLARKKPDIAALPVFENNADTAEMLKQLDARAAHLEKVDAEVREWEKKSSKAAEAELKSRAARIASELAASHAGKNFCVSEVPNADGKLLQAVVDALKPKFNGPIFLVGAAKGRRISCIRPKRNDIEISGEQDHSENRANRRRERRRPTGERSRRRTQMPARSTKHSLKRKNWSARLDAPGHSDTRTFTAMPA